MAQANTNPLDYQLVPFENPLGHIPFLSDNDDDNLALFSWKPEVVGWTLKLVKFTAMVMYKTAFTDPYFPLHLNARATAFEAHHSKYMLMKCILHQSEETSEPLHFGIVVEVGEDCGAQFDPVGFLQELKRSRHGMEEWWAKKIHTWENINQENTVRKLGSMLSRMSELEEEASKKPAAKRKSSSNPSLPPLSGGSTPMSGAHKAKPRAAPKRKLLADAIASGGPAGKGKRQRTATVTAANERPTPTEVDAPAPTEGEAPTATAAASEGHTPAASQASALTSSMGAPPKQKKDHSKDDEQDYVKFASMQTNFERAFSKSFRFSKAGKTGQNISARAGETHMGCA